MHSLSEHPLYHFFYAKNICIPGASSKEKSIGYELLKTIKSYGFTGTIFPVNPSSSEILGYECFPSVEAITVPIDLAIVVVPKKFVFETITPLLHKGVKAIVLITAGFKETGAEGAANEQNLVELIQSSGARMVGPNCMGVINSFHDYRLNATFVAEHPKECNAAFLSQSGALGAAVLNTLRETDYSFGHFVSVGNKADINENDVLDFWLQDERIHSVAMYLESFVDGENLIGLLNNTKRAPKPIIIVKAGRGEAGMKAASSHTGALGGSDRVANTVLKQFGIIRAESIDEMFQTVQAFDYYPPLQGKRIAVLTNAGGPAILCVDALERKALTLASLSESTKIALREFVHPEGSVNNPVDLLPGGTHEQYHNAATLLLQDEQVDALISIFVEPVMVPAMPVIENLQIITSGKPHLIVTMPLPEFWPAYRAKSSTQIKPLYRKPEEPSFVLANLLQFHQYQLNSITSKRLQPEYKESLRVDDKSKATATQSRWLNNQELEDICRGYEIPLMHSITVPANRLHNVLEQVSFPMVLKGIAEGLTHKSDAQLVVLNIGNAEQLLREAGAMTERSRNAGIVLHSFLLQPFIQQRFELLLGGFRDASFGPMIMFGTGGKYVEVLNDTAIRSAYASAEDISSIIDDVAVGKLLAGVRGEKAVDRLRLKEILTSCAQLLLDHPNIREFDFNPLIVTTSGEFVCVDARIRIED